MGEGGEREQQPELRLGGSVVVGEEGRRHRLENGLWLPLREPPTNR